MENLLALMMRQRNARNLDSRYQAAVDGAYFAVRPPDGGAAKRRRREPLLEYIRHLIFDVLADDTIVYVLKKLMKLPWQETEQYVLKCLLKVTGGIHGRWHVHAQWAHLARIARPYSVLVVVFAMVY